jgi:hypothetical protein
MSDHFIWLSRIPGEHLKNEGLGEVATASGIKDGQANG